MSKDYGWRPYAGFKTTSVEKVLRSTYISRRNLLDRQSDLARYYDKTILYLEAELKARKENGQLPKGGRGDE